MHRYAPEGDNNLWKSTLKDKYIMDRNLGAMSAFDNEYSNTIGLYYQFGRKDPLPDAKTKLYDINGMPLTGSASPMWPSSSDDCMKVIENPAPYIYHSVKHPYVIYPYTNHDWVNHVNNKYYLSRWYNPEWYDSETGKSFFDPCPRGWRIPDNISIWNSILGSSTLVTQGTATFGRFFTLKDNTQTFYPLISDSRNLAKSTNGRYVTYQISGTYAFGLRLRNNYGNPSTGEFGRGTFWSVRPVRE